jgi:galactokinase
MPLAFKDLEAKVDSQAVGEGAGWSEPATLRKTRLMKRLLKVFREAFEPHPEEEVYAFYVPGRLEVFGKHTDYAGGHSLLFPLDRGFHCICRPSRAERVRIRDLNPSFGERAFEVSSRLTPRVGDWANYPMTVVKRVCKNFGEGLRGVDIVFASDLPIAGGMSGSSALMIMVYLAFAAANELEDHPLYQDNIQDTLDLAMYLACVENGQSFRALAGDRGVGTFGGSEDHTIILAGKPGIISLYQFAPTLHKADISYPRELAYIILYSGVRAEKTGEAMYKYNLVSRRARLVVERYNQAYGTTHLILRDIVEENRGLECEALLARVEAASKGYFERGRDLDLPGRFRQFYLEDREYIPEATRALAFRDPARLAQVTNLSHQASQKYLWNIVPEISFLQEEALRQGALAASGFGAGFGGSAYAVCWQEDAEQIIAGVAEAYRSSFPQLAGSASFFQTAPSRGAFEITVKP